MNHLFNHLHVHYHVPLRHARSSSWWDNWGHTPQPNSQRAANPIRLRSLIQRSPFCHISCPGLISIRSHPFTCTVLLTCNAPFSQITGSSRLASHLGSLKSPYEASIRSTMGLCTGAAMSLCLITREPLFGTLTCAEGSSCAGTQPISLLCC